MAKKDENFTYQIKEILGIATPQETLSGDWVKAVLYTLMGEEEEPGVDIRKYNAGTKRSSTGIRMSLQEAHNATDILLRNGYGSIEVLEEELVRRKNMFSGGSSNGLND